MNYPLSQRGRTYAIYISLTFLLILIIAIAFGGYRLVLQAPAPAQDPVHENKSIVVPGTEEEPEPAPEADPLAYEQAIPNIVNGDTSGRWPVKTPPSLSGSILPYNLVIPYCGNLHSKQMRILGELAEVQMLAKLQSVVDAWNNADTTMEAMPALHYIAVTAQQQPGKAGKYRLRMPFHQIDSVIKMAAKIIALVFIDVQVGHSTLQSEIPEFEKYLKMPNVHLGLDPEF